jgi:hypothetical protein
MPRSYDDDDSDDDLDIVRRPHRRRRGTTDVAARVMGPGVALMAVAIISFGVFTFACPVNIIGLLNKPELPGREAERVGNFVGAAICMPLFMISNIVVAVGGYLMYTRSSYSMAMTAAVLSLIPCFSPCYIVGIPFAIWALVVLNDPDVKDAFRA